MKKPFFKTKKFIFGLAALLLIGGSCLGFRHKRAKAEAARIASMLSVKPDKGVLVTKTQAIATVEPENRVLVTPSLAGRAEEVLFREGEDVVKGQVLAWISSSERTALLDSLRMRDAAPRERKMVEEAYNLTPVVAPIDGMVVKRAVEPGQSVSQSKELAVISDRLIVKTFVDETDIGAIKAGQKAEFYLDAFPNKMRTGRVIAISHESTLKDGVIVYEVKILPSGSIPALRSGMTADVLVVTGSKKDALTVPKRAVKYRDGEALVSVKEEGRLTEKKVLVGASGDKSIEITSGLSENDTVYYSTGITRERSGIRIRL